MGQIREQLQVLPPSSDFGATSRSAMTSVDEAGLPAGGFRQDEQDLQRYFFKSCPSGRSGLRVLALNRAGSFGSSPPLMMMLIQNEIVRKEEFPVDARERLCWCVLRKTDF